LAKIPFKNIDEQAAPPCAVMEITGTVFEDGVAFMTCRRPSTTLRHEFAINGSVRVAAGSKGICYRQGDVSVAYDDGSPLVGDARGPRAGQWTAARGYPHLVTVHGVRNSVARILHGGLRNIVSVVGVAETEIPAIDEGDPGLATAQLYVWNGDAFVAADPATSFTAYNLLTYPVPAEQITRFTLLGGLWIAAGSERQTLQIVKANAMVSPSGGSGMVTRWKINGAGVEEASDPLDQFMARNRTSVAIEAGVFCLALYIDNTWYIEPWECETT